MSNEIANPEKSTDLSTLSHQIEQVMMQGDLTSLSPSQRVEYHNQVCQSLGINPLTKPFEYIKLNGKLQLYAKKDATDQLRKINQISIKIVEKQAIEGIYMVTAQAVDKSGRMDEATGMVSIGGLKGQDLANAFMKAETKAKRRVTLSICGLGLLDESEVDDIPMGQKNVTPQAQTNFLPQAAPKHDALVQAFMGVDVSEDDILRTYDIGSLDELEPSQVGDLREAYQEIRAGNKAKSDYFAEPMEVPE